jgi:hypothetical protein
MSARAGGPRVFDANLLRARVFFSNPLAVVIAIIIGVTVGDPA